MVVVTGTYRPPEPPGLSLANESNTFPYRATHPAVPATHHHPAAQDGGGRGRQQQLAARPLCHVTEHP